MVEIDDKIVSGEIITSRFCCNIGVCKGACCVEGSSGAPLEAGEEELLRANFEHYKQYLKPRGLAAIEEQGFAVVDYDGDLTTPLINDAECAYSIENNGSTWCAIEKAYVNGQGDYHKPISCHLYPIRLVNLANGYTGLQYHRWSICRSGEIKGAKDGVPLYVALKDAIIRKFGVDFYDQLVQCEQYINAQDELHATYNR